MGSSVSAAPALSTSTDGASQTTGTVRSGETSSSASLSEENCPLLGTWEAVEWSPSAKRGGDPDPTNDEKIVIITANSVVFPAGTTFPRWTLTNAQCGHFTTADQESVAMNVEGDRLTVEFGYAVPATITYRRVATAAAADTVTVHKVGGVDGVEYLDDDESPPPRQKAVELRICAAVLCIAVILVLSFAASSAMRGEKTPSHEPYGWCGVGTEHSLNAVTTTSEPCDDDLYRYLCDDDELNKGDSKLLGRWTAVEWTANAVEGGDPDPVNDENTVIISVDAVDFPQGTYFPEWTLTDLESGSLTTSEEETITMNYFQYDDGERLSIWFGYELPATILYQRE